MDIDTEKITLEYINQLKLVNKLLENKVATNYDIIGMLEKKYYELQKLKSTENLW